MIKIEIKNRFTGNVIFEYEKENNSIKCTVEEAVRQEKSLDYASLDYASLDKRYISITRIGSSNRMTTYCFDDDIVWCGCFKGTLQEFENKVNETHKANDVYLKQYLGAINYIKSLK